jgi:valyl-tRNA synthetase
VVKLAEAPIEDRWILSRLPTTAKQVTESLEGYHFSDVARTIYDFTWSEFCDWYIEMAKGRLKDPAGRLSVQRVLVGVLDGILKLVHPVMPFVAESIWQALNEAAFERGLPNPDPSTESVVIAPWPEYPAEWIDAAMERRFALMQELVRGIREVRNRYMIDAKTPLEVAVRCGEDVAGDFRSLAPFIALLAGVGKFESGPSVAKPAQASTQVNPQFEAYVSLKGLIDPAAEVKRLEKQLVEKRKQLEGTQKKLANADFKARAPKEVVEQQEALIGELEKQIGVLEGTIQDLKQE